MAEAGHVVEEQPDGGRLVHDDVVALVGTAPVDEHVRHRAQRLVGAGAAGVLPPRREVARSSPSARLSVTR